MATISRFTDNLSRYLQLAVFVAPSCRRGGCQRRSGLYQGKDSVGGRTALYRRHPGRNGLRVPVSSGADCARGNRVGALLGAGFSLCCPLC